MTLPIADLQFLRPAWLLALLLLPLLAWAWRRRARRRSGWRTAVDAHLLPHLIDARGGGRDSSLAGVATLAGLALAIVALAGPSWRGVPQPLQGGGSALVIVLDLSSATLANDLQPSRLVQARARIDALLHAHAGEVALVAYADDAFVVSPVTSDPDNVAVFLDALAPDVMPVDGQRAGRGIDRASELLARAGHARGDILLLAPGAGRDAVRAATRAAADGYRVSVLAMGTEAGAGYRGRDGEIHRSALDPGSLRALAAAGGGSTHAWGEPPAEVVATLGGGGASGARAGAAAADASRGLVREDGGYWLLPLAMVLLLVAFRRGGVLAVLALCMVLPMQPGFAAGAGPPVADAWRRADQAAHARSAEAEAAYREGDFAAAARGFDGLPGADAAYNRGNALARAGRYEEAIAAYDEALGEVPGMPDALANRAAVEAVMAREPPDGGAGGGDMPPDGGKGDLGAGDETGDRGDDGRAPPDADAGKEPGQDPPSPPPQPPDPGDDAGPPPAADEIGDAEARARQQAADEAQREAMQRAIDAGDARDGGSEPGDGRDASERTDFTAAAEREQANAAWLRRVPDDPGALLRARFRNEHLRRRAGER
ncbi:VWA domain-containing protein [Luteimonas sp. A537]